MLARHGRLEEAFDLLGRTSTHWVLATALVDVASVAGRDEEAAALLATRIRADPAATAHGAAAALTPDTALGLLATIRERQGHTR